MIQPTYTAANAVCLKIAIWCGFPQSQISFSTKPYRDVFETDVFEIKTKTAFGYRSLFSHSTDNIQYILGEILRNSKKPNSTSDIRRPTNSQFSILLTHHRYRHDLYMKLQSIKRELLKLRGMRIKRYKDVRHANH